MEKELEFAKELKELPIEKAPFRKAAVEEDGLSFEVVTDKKQRYKSPQKDHLCLSPKMFTSQFTPLRDTTSI